MIHSPCDHFTFGSYEPPASFTKKPTISYYFLSENPPSHAGWLWLVRFGEVSFFFVTFVFFLGQNWGGFVKFCGLAVRF